MNRVEAGALAAVANQTRQTEQVGVRGLLRNARTHKPITIAGSLRHEAEGGHKQRNAITLWETPQTLEAANATPQNAVCKEEGGAATRTHRRL